MAVLAPASPGLAHASGLSTVPGPLMRFALLCIAALILFCPARSLAAPSKPDQRDAELRQTVARLAQSARANDTETLLKRFAPDAVVQVDDTVLARGIDDLARLLRPLDAMSVSTFSVAVNKVEARSPLWITHGTFSAAAGVAGIEALNGRGTFHAAWRQNAQHIWLITRLELRTEP